MAPCGVIFHENVNFLFVAQKCQVIHAFHKTRKQNVIALIRTHIFGDFINNMVFGDQRFSTKNEDGEQHSYQYFGKFIHITGKPYTHRYIGHVQLNKTRTRWRRVKTLGQHQVGVNLQSHAQHQLWISTWHIFHEFQKIMPSLSYPVSLVDQNVILVNIPHWRLHMARIMSLMST